MLDVSESKSVIDLSEVLMLEMFKDETGCSQVRTPYYVVQFYNVGVRKGLEDVILSSNFFRSDWEEHLNHYFFFRLRVLAFEDLRISTATDFMADCVPVHLTA